MDFRPTLTGGMKEAGLLPGRTARRAVAAIVALLASTAPPPLSAATVPTGYQEYFVIGREQQVWDMLYRVATAEGQNSFDNSGNFWNGMNSVVSATASADNQVIYYDHWEDGYEADLLNPVQATTLVLGDDDPSNGRACDFTADPRVLPCGGATQDLLFQGSFVNLNSDQGLPGVTPNPNPNGSCQGGLPAAPLDQRCSVPVNPRNPADIRFDGGDRIITSGGPLSLLHPMDPLSPFIGGATEIISRQAVAAARSYSIPVGEDSYGGDNSVTEPFKYVDLDLVAFEDGTQVSIDSPGAGIVSFTLNQGQHYSSRGLIDDTTAAPALAINEGTKVSTSAPIAGMIFTGGDANFAVRMYTLLPDLLHSTDYVITAPGDDPASQGSRPLNLYILNPDPLTAIDVTVTDSVGNAVVNIPPNSIVDYRTGTGRFVPPGSTVRLTSDRNFWGVSAYDYASPSNDWGHSWLARKFLTETYTVSFAPGVTNPALRSQPAQRTANDGDCTILPTGVGLCDTLNRSPVFVSATLDNTLVTFDLDNDGLYDLVDTDGDDCPDQGDASDATCAVLPASWNGRCGLTADGTTPGNCIYAVDALESLRAYDYTDYDNSGTRIAANKPVSVAYGQDTDQATGPDPIQDTGYTIYPINQLFLDPVLVVDKGASTTTVPTAGGSVTYTLTVRSFEFGGLTNLSVFDLLPPGISGSDYVPGSTLITYPNLVQETTDPATAIDATTGRDRLDWTLTQTSLGARQVLTIQYDIAIPDSSGLSQPIRLLQNEGHAQAQIGGSIFSPFDTAEVVQTDVVLNKSSNDDGTLSGGEVVQFTLSVENIGVTDETGVTISDPIPPDTTFLTGSIANAGPFTGVFDAAQNAVVWTAGTFGSMTGPFDLVFEVTVNPLVPAGTVIPNRGGYESVETPYFLSNEVAPVVVGPSLEFFKTGPALLHPNEVATFEITVRNVGADAANALLIQDPFPANTAYVPGSMEWHLNSQPFASLTDAADADQGTAFVDRVELLLASLGPRQDATFRFRVQVAPGTDGLFVNNQATVSSTEVPPTDTNLVQAPIVGGADATGHIFLDLDGNGVQNGAEPDLAGVDVVVTDPSGTTQTVTTDANGDWLATVGVTQSCYLDQVNAIGYSGSNGSLAWGATPWVEASDDGNPATGDVAAVADPLRPGNAFWLQGGPSNTNRALRRPANPSTLAGVTLSFDYLNIGNEPDDIVTIEVSYNGGAFTPLGTIPGADPDDTAWQSQSYALTAAPLVLRFRTSASYAFGSDTFYFDNISICGSSNLAASVNVDETDPDIPAGATLTTANDPQGFNVAPGGTVATGDVGYQPVPLTFTKSSDAGAAAVPGQTLTYALQVTNYTAVTQTGVALVDPVPDGTTYVPGGTTAPALRVTEYNLGSGDFTGTSYDLTLGQPLSPDYFAIVQGSAGDGTNNGDRGPDANYAAIVDDPFGTGDLGTSGGSNVLTLTRGNGADDWIGVVTVVECLSGCDTAGFQLLDVQRVIHSGTGTGGADASTVAWSDINQVMLMGGFNGAGCNTGDGDVADTKVCHARLWPSGAAAINWSRNNGGVTLSTATSTVMVVEWGSEWNVQSVRVQGSNGGDGVNAAGEYNTAAIAPVTRAQTWVWGTGHTDDNGLGDASEGVVVTLGNGVAQNGTEATVAVATEYGGTAVDFQVWALQHPDLAVDQVFKADGDTGNLTVDVAVASATANRMALSYNTQNGTGTAYPRPFFSARYLADDTVRLERRRSGQGFAAWVQGIDFDAVDAAVATAPPPNLIVPADGVTLAPGQTLTVTFQVVVDSPLDPSATEITNTATLTTDQDGPYVASVTDPVVRPSVIVEPNNAGYAAAGNTITYTHQVVNTWTGNDSFTITGVSERGWVVELIDPDTGAVVAADTNGDGAWEGGVVVNTGTLPPGGFVEYDVRVTVPGGAALGTQDTTRLVATSDRSPSVFATGTDETTVVPVQPPGPGRVILTPDNSGIVRAGEWTAYTHVVINLTPYPDTFLLAGDSAAVWAGTFHWDANGDGVYTPGTDLAITNTAQLPPGGSQVIFYVVNAPIGASPGTVDVTHLTATPTRPENVVAELFGAASDTTTVVGDPTHDLSGGGSVVVAAGDTPIHPGTLSNLGYSDDRYNLALSVANLYGVDGLDHPTQLWVDTNGDGVTDTEVARDDDGDGTWDFVDPAWDTDGDPAGLPDIPVLAGGTTAYELRRPVAAAQSIQRDYVTLTSTSIGFPATDPDNVTATWVFAAATRAAIRGVRVDPGGEVSFVTANQAGTASFTVYQTADASGATGREALHDSPVPSPVPHSLTPILYRVPTRPITMPYVMIQEVETDGDVLWKGPFAVGNRRLRRAFDTVDRLMAEAGIPRDSVQQVRGMRPLSFGAAPQGSRRAPLRGRGRHRHGALSLRAEGSLRRQATDGVRIDVHGPGRVRVPLDALQAAGLRVRPGGRLVLSNLGQPVPYQWEEGATWTLVFQAEALSTDYSGSNAYIATAGSVPRGVEVPFTASGDPPRAGFTRIEKSTLYVPSLPDGTDPWQWDFLFSGWPWPDPGWDPTAGDFDLPGLVPGTAGLAEVRIRLVGYTHHSHTVTASINGLPVGSLTFDGVGAALLVGAIDASSLAPSGNSLSLTYVGTDLPDSTEPDAMAYLDYLDLAVPSPPVADAAWELSAYRPRLPVLRDAEYLVITHPLFTAQADRLAALKAAEGMRAVVVQTDAAYDRFSGGVVEPRAIQALVRHAFHRSEGALRFILLVGDDTFDPRDYVGIGSQSFVPSLFGRDASWGLVPTETAYADVDDDGRPDVAIGRLPVHSEEEADAVVDKIEVQAQALAAVQQVQLVVADNYSDTDAPFPVEAEHALSLLPPTASVRWSLVEQGTTAAHDALLDGWEAGSMVTHYFGHGGLTEWADEQVLTVADVAALGSTWKPTVLFSWACLSQWHIGIDGPALNESLILSPVGGAVASFGPAGITYPARQADLREALYRELAQPGISLGEAIRRAKNATLDLDPRSHGVVEGFQLFGDPSLRIPWPAPVVP